jgi:hypothetical protein
VPTLDPFVFVPLCAFGLGGGFTLGMTLPLDNTHNVEEANVWNAFVPTVGYLIAAAGPLRRTTTKASRQLKNRDSSVSPIRVTQSIRRGLTPRPT